MKEEDALVGVIGETASALGVLVVAPAHLSKEPTAFAALAYTVYYNDTPKEKLPPEPWERFLFDIVSHVAQDMVRNTLEVTPDAVKIMQDRWREELDTMQDRQQEDLDKERLESVIGTDLNFRDLDRDWDLVPPRNRERLLHALRAAWFMHRLAALK